jgi:hypothetical protein
MPIRKRAIAESIPNSQNKPGKRCQQDEDKMDPSCFFPNPAKKIEHNQDGMEGEKKDV